MGLISVGLSIDGLHVVAQRVELATVFKRLAIFLPQGEVALAARLFKDAPLEAVGVLEVFLVDVSLAILSLGRARLLDLAPQHISVLVQATRIVNVVRPSVPRGHVRDLLLF